MARIVPAANAYDVMTSHRAYRHASLHELAIGEIVRCSGTRFDPEIAAEFTDRIAATQSHILDLALCNCVCRHLVLRAA